MAKSPTAVVARQSDKDQRDRDHQETLAAEASRRAKEPRNGNQPWPRKSRPQS
jgi:hypothetical protein